MMQAILSRFTPKYLRALTYMLQASEYYIRDYLSWYFSTSDFSKVEVVGKLKFTNKARLIWLFLWLNVLGIVVKVMTFTLLYTESFGYWPLLLILLIPYVLPFLAIIPVLFISYGLQKPYEAFIAGRLKKELAAHKGTKIAIAGSYGKTTMREILRSVLGSGKKVASPSGSINTLLGINAFMKTLSGDEDILLFEIGEYYPGDVAKLANIIQPDIGVITGINEAHLKRFGNIERTVATIYELADFVTPKSLYVNGENQLARAAASDQNHLYTREGCDKTKVVSATSGLEGTELSFTRGKESVKAHSGLLGLHLVGSIAAAVEIAYALGLSGKEVKRGLEQTKPFARRLEMVSDKGGVITLDDSYNGNPDGVKAVIDFLASLKNKRIVYVTSGLVEMGDKTQEVHLQIANYIAKAKISNVLLVNTSATQIIARGLEAENFEGKVLMYDDTESAYKAISQLTVPGDVVLLQNNWPDQYK